MPVNCGSSQVPVGALVLGSQRDPALGRPARSPAASRASSAQAVCEAVDGAAPGELGSS